ncbi:HIT-like protein [Lentinus tigrinus ALCF2SS1-7]|uniref:HIT-like protein n=1 Tax=Lentinus tigrinus ALCF2SS1-7 TaxID=1328758 RepID=UPI0011661C43|nr:HIT-like protein [Lentinus tigrinus ALCF2SS1-7]
MATHKEILAKLEKNFDSARESGDLLFFPSEVHTHAENGVEFQIRLCPALQNKPRLPTPDFSKDAPSPAAQEKKRHDPFAPPYVPALYLGEVRDESEGHEYVILFNKYSVVPHHFMLVTKADFQSQTSPLLPADLVQVYLFLLAAKALGRKYFAFYNCGDLSGASQPHKHVQLIPLDDDGPPVEKLARATKLDRESAPFSLAALPYANHVRRLPSSLSSTTDFDTLEQALAGAFIPLLDLAFQTVRHDASYPAGTPSYNVFLTLEHMHVVPRRQEAHTLAGTGEQLSVNALGFAGMLLVKSERELEAVREEGVTKILRGVALEAAHEAQTESFRVADDHADAPHED